MGYASYLEDIISRFEKFKAVIEDHNESSLKKIDIDGYFDIRREILGLVEQLKPYADKNIDIIENQKLRNINQGLQLQVETVKQQNLELVKKIKDLTKSEKEKDKQQTGQITELKKQLSTSNQKALKLSQTIETLTQNLNVCRHNLHDCRQNQIPPEDNYGDLLIDVTSIFQQIKGVIKSNNWFNDKDNHKQIELLIERGLSIA